MPDFHFTHGDVADSLSIMREACQWLHDIGQPMWHAEELTRRRLRNPADEFVVMRDTATGNSIATMLLSYHDPFFWPDVLPNASGFVHKLAVRRAYAGQGHGERLLAYAADTCQANGVHALRLDTDPHRPGLCALYERAGFVCVGMKAVTIPGWGRGDMALYCMTL